MTKTFTVKSFNHNIKLYESKHNMGKKEKANFRVAMLYRCLVYSNTNKKGN